MDSFKEPCHHRSIPVEMDESMTASCLNLDWPPPCQECSGPPETRKELREHGCEQVMGAARDVGQWRRPENQYQHEPRVAPYAASQTHFTPPSAHAGQMNPLHAAGVRQPPDLRLLASLYEQDFMVNSRSLGPPSNWAQNHSVREAVSLEPPCSLKSVDLNMMQDGHHRQCYCCPPANPPHPNQNRPQEYRAEPRQIWNPHHDGPQPKNSPPGSHPRYVGPSDPVLHEVSVAATGRGPATREIRKTISLPAECRNVFITYSVDTAQEMIPFAKFLSDQGFEPAIDIFDNPIRRMHITKWMDSFLNNKSVIIIVVISPKYKEDVEGNGDDEHGLHTKYIHNQIQNEFIQQGCLNFRLVPVLFPNATKNHVPNWLRNTRIYRWPRDTQDLLLRLFREERYIIPPRAGDLTLTVRPV